MNEYHNIFVPLVDVFQDGGPSAFTHLSRKEKGKKNLLVITSNILRELKNKASKGSQSAYDIGEYMRTHFEKTLELQAENEKPLRAFTLDETLDVLMLPFDFVDTTNYFDVKSFAEPLVDKLQKYATSEDGHVDFLTNNDFDATEIQNLNLKQSKPGFLIANADIVKRGMIQSSADFQSLMHEEETVSLDMAQEYFDEKLHMNQFINLGGESYAKVTGKIIRDGLNIKGVKDLVVEKLSTDEHDRILKVGNHEMRNVLGVEWRDMHQYLAFKYGMYDPNITTSFITGSQGSGKTLIAYAAAVDMMLNYSGKWHKDRIANRPNEPKGQFYDKLILLKPIVSATGEDLGFLPGSLADKLAPYLEPFQDAHKKTDLYTKYNITSIDQLFSIGDEKQVAPSPANAAKKTQKTKKFDDAKKINGANPPAPNSMEIIFYGNSRGRSFENTLIIVDEAQNLKPTMMKTLIERMSTGSKMVILGDPLQVDARSGCTNDMNGLTQAYKHLMYQPFTAGIHLVKHYRSHDSKAVLNWKVY